MRTGVCFGLALVVTLLAVRENALAQGKGQGLTKAMSAASKSSSSAGLGRASQNLSKAGSSFGKSNAGLNRAVGGANRSAMGLNHAHTPGTAPLPGDSGTADGAIEQTQPDANQQQILDQRLGQAEKLRQLSERNGNTRLLDTADRMDANAIRNYERQSGQLYQPSGDLTPPSDLAPMPDVVSQSGSLPPAGKAAPQTRTSWLPAWLRWSR